MKKQFWIKFGVMIAVVIVLLTLDIVTKYVFDAILADGRTLTIIPYLFNFKLTHNFGAAWGMLAGKQVFLIVLTLLFVAVFIWFYVKEKNKSWLFIIAFAFVIAGCFGNLYDRLVFGYVRDFIQFDFWQSFPIFNFADAALCIGMVLFVIWAIVYFAKGGQKEKNVAISKNQKISTLEKNSRKGENSTDDTVDNAKDKGDKNEQ